MTNQNPTDGYRHMRFTSRNAPAGSVLAEVVVERLADDALALGDAAGVDIMLGEDLVSSEMHLHRDLHLLATAVTRRSATREMRVERFEVVDVVGTEPRGRGLWSLHVGPSAEAAVNGGGCRV